MQTRTTDNANIDVIYYPVDLNEIASKIADDNPDYSSIDAAERVMDMVEAWSKVRFPGVRFRCWHESQPAQQPFAFDANGSRRDDVVAEVATAIDYLCDMGRWLKENPFEFCDNGNIPRIEIVLEEGSWVVAGAYQRRADSQLFYGWFSYDDALGCDECLLENWPPVVKAFAHLRWGTRTHVVVDWLPVGMRPDDERVVVEMYEGEKFNRQVLHELKAFAMMVCHHPRLKAVDLEPQSFVKGLYAAWNTFKEGK